MMKLIISLMRLMLILITFDAVSAQVNVTFTLKNDGTLLAQSDIGTFDSTATLLTISGNQLPIDFRDATPIDVFYDRFRVFDYVQTINSDNNGSGEQVAATIRLKSLYALSASTQKYLSEDGTCDGGSNIASGQYRIFTEQHSNINNECSSDKFQVSDLSESFVAKKMYLEEISFSFFESGALDKIRQQRLRAGTYTFAPVRMTVMHHLDPGYNYRYWYINIRMVIEPFVGSVSMPTALPLDVSVASANRLTGKGAVLATVTGSLAKNLKIVPRSANSGLLVKGSERIPYTLSVVPLSGDNKSRLLIDGNNGGAQPDVVMSTDDKIDQYQLRFDASFSSTLSGLSSGRFSDNVTLIFTTSDLP